MSEAISLKQQTQENVRERVHYNRHQEEKSNIEENVFFNIIQDSAIEPEQKVEEIAKTLTFTNDKEKDRANIKAFEEFKEYLQQKSEEMSRERIKMTDTGTFSELQKVYGDFNNDLNEFIEKIKPLTDTTDALYTLRKNGETRSVLAKIQHDKADRRELEEELQGVINQLENIDYDIKEIMAQNYLLAEDKSFFGFGNIKPESKAKIKDNENTLNELNTKRTELDTKLTELNNKLNSMDSGEGYSFEAQKLKELLDLNSEEHIQRQADLIESALKFINTGKERFGSIREHLGLMDKQIEGLTDNNGKMLQIYAVLNDATKQAEEANKKQRDELANLPEPESAIKKMQLDSQKRDLDEHIDTVSQSTVDTMQTYGELSIEEIKLRNMQAATKNQSQAATTMHSRGIASVASQLSVVLTAVNSAAINESQVMASDTLTQMAKVTNDVAMKESIRIATGRDDINIELEKTLQDLVDFGDTQKQATDITRDAISTMRNNLDELEKLAKDVQGDTAEFVAVTADTISDKKKEKKATKSNSLFK